MQTLKTIQDNGHLNIMYVLIMNFSIENEFNDYKCGVCNHKLKKVSSTNTIIRCSIGYEIIDTTNDYFTCSMPCWGNYNVCQLCAKYGILRYMMDNTRTRKYNAFTKFQKFQVDKQIKKYQPQCIWQPSPIIIPQNKTSKRIHIYTQYPNKIEENFYFPSIESNGGNVLQRRLDSHFMNMRMMADEKYHDFDDSDSESDSDDDESDSNSDSEDDDYDDERNGKIVKNKKKKIKKVLYYSFCVTNV